MTGTPPAETAGGKKPVLCIVLLDSAAPDLAASVCDMHTRLLPTSPAVLLGKRFLRDFYYTLLPAHGLIRAAVACVDDVPAGFIAVTRDPNGFMGAAIKRWWNRIAWMLSLSIVEQPFTRIPALWEAVQIMTSRKEGDPEPGAGEFLSLGVLPEFTDPKFVQQAGLRIARDLVVRGVQLLAEDGATKVTAVVDADNLPARMMYFGLGWKLTRSHVPGWRTPSVEFAHEIAES